MSWSGRETHRGWSGAMKAVRQKEERNRRQSSREEERNKVSDREKGRNGG